MSDLLTPELEERFSFLRRLDQLNRGTDGGKVTASTAQVWLALCKATGEKRVVKVRWMNRGGFEDLLGRIKDLGETGAERHGLVPVLDFGWDGFRHHSVYSHFPSGTLRHWLGRNRGERPEEARQALRDLSAALRWLHQGAGPNGFIHGDVKPSNILVDESGGTPRFRLGDYDAALVKPQARRGANPLVASAGYAPPERFDRGYYEASDYWQLGMVVGEIAMGMHPLEAEKFSDAADLPDGWLLSSASFRQLGEDWRALLYGLLALRPGDRWGPGAVADWLGDDERRRVAAVQDGLRLGHVPCATEPFRIGGIAALTASSAAEAFQLTRDPAVIQDPAPLADWVQGLGLGGAAVRIRRSVEVADPDLREVEIAIALHPDLPPRWRGLPIDPNTIFEYARFDAPPSQAEWLQSLRTSDVFDHYARQNRQDVADIAATLGESRRGLESAWAWVEAAGYEVDAPDEAEMWRRACRIAFDKPAIARAREELARLTDASELFVRPAWLGALGGNPASLSDEQAVVLAELSRRWRLENADSEARFTERIDTNDASNEELARRPIIRLSSQKQLLATTVPMPATAGTTIGGGEYYPADDGASLFFAVRRWLRQVLYPAIAVRLGRDPLERMRRASTVGSPYREPPQLVVSAAVYTVAAKVPDLIEGPEGKAALVYWNAPPGFTARIELRVAGLLRDRLLWRTPLLPRSGQMVFALPRSTVISLVSTPELRLWPRPKFRSPEMVLNLPEPELECRGVGGFAEHVAHFACKPGKLDHPACALGEGLEPLRFRKVEGKLGFPPGFSDEEIRRSRQFAAPRVALRARGRVSGRRRSFYRFVEGTTPKGSASNE